MRGLSELGDGGLSTYNPGLSSSTYFVYKIFKNSIWWSIIFGTNIIQHWKNMFVLFPPIFKIFWLKAFPYPHALFFYCSNLKFSGNEAEFDILYENTNGMQIMNLTS